MKNMWDRLDLSNPEHQKLFEKAIKQAEKATKGMMRSKEIDVSTPEGCEEGSKYLTAMFAEVHNSLHGLFRSAGLLGK
jgi:hypothetical protein